MSKRLVLITALLALSALPGCSQLSKPRIPRAVDHHLPKILYTEDQLGADRTLYETQMKAAANAPTDPNRYDSAKITRDGVIFNVKGDIDAYYREYELLLNNRRAGFDIASDVTQLSIAAATTITNGARGKTVLAAILSFVQGSRLSVNDNYFREKTTPAIISQMQANRTSAQNLILQKMKLTPDQYSLGEALDDLTDYFYQGTLIAGIVGLTNSAGTQATAAKAETKSITSARTISADERARLDDMNKRYWALFAAKDYDSARLALKALKVPNVESLDNSVVFQRLREALSDQTISTDEKLSALKPSKQ